MTKLKKEYITVFLLMTIGLIVSSYFMFRNLKSQSNLIQINFESGLNLNVNDAYNSGGLYILNSKYSIESFTSILGENYGVSENKAIWRPKSAKYIPRISDISAPFEIIKEANNDTIKLIKSNKTIYLLLK